MTAFRLLVTALGASVLVYTLAILPEHGFGFVAAFLSDLVSLSWPGQFNLDFACYLVLSALWVAWRGGFTPVSLGLAAVASVFGMLFFAPFLLWLSVATRGDMAAFLLGVNTPEDIAQ